MTTTRTLEVRPFYGWGWADSDPGAAWDDVPAPFHAEVAPKTEVWFESPVRTLQGTVVEPAHPLDRYFVLLSQRHVDRDGDVNISLRSEAGRELNGFGAIDLASFDG